MFVNEKEENAAGSSFRVAFFLCATSVGFPNSPRFVCLIGMIESRALSFSFDRNRFFFKEKQKKNEHY